jgi:hypothetical protein
LRYQNPLDSSLPAHHEHIPQPKMPENDAVLEF